MQDRRQQIRERQHVRGEAHPLLRNFCVPPNNGEETPQTPEVPGNTLLNRNIPNF